MRKLLRWSGYLLATLVVVVAALFAFGWWKSDHDLATVYTIEDPPLIAADPATVRTEGAHLFVTRGCGECHGRDGAGTLLFDAGPVARISAANITPAGLGGRYDLDAVGRAIRHGVRADGTPLVFMPAEDYAELSDRDTALLAGYVLSLPPADTQAPPLEVRPLGRVLYALGAFPLVPATGIDHTPRQREAPPLAANPQYGFYLAQVCAGCHGDDFAGKDVAPGKPRSADLRPGARLAGWTEADFMQAMREGKRPDGSAIDPFMPWPAFKQMSDAELSALWQYLQTLPPAA